MVEKQELLKNSIFQRKGKVLRYRKIERKTLEKDLDVVYVYL